MFYNRAVLATLLLGFALTIGIPVQASAPQLPADPYLDAAAAAQARGDVPAALEALSRSIAGNAGPGREATLAEGYRRRGGILDGQGRFAEALADFTRARQLAEDLGDRPAVASGLAAIAGVYQALGNGPMATDAARASLDIGNELGDTSIMAKALNTLGIVSEVGGDYRAALDYYTRSLDFRRAIGDKRRIAYVLLNIGNVYSAQGNYPLALDQYGESLALAQATADRSFEATVYITIGNAYGRAGDYAVALENLERSLAINRAIKNDLGIAYATLNIAEAQRLEGRLEEARASFLDALSQTDRLEDKGLRAATLLSLSKVQNQLGDPAQSLDTARRALALAIEVGERETIWDAQATAGVAYRALKQDDQAAVSFDEAIANIEAMRATIAGGEEESERSFETKILPYHAMVELLVDRGRPVEALTYAERAKGRVLLDVLHSGRVQVTKSMTASEQATERRLSDAVATINRGLAHPASAADAGLLPSALANARGEYDAFQAGLYATHPELKAIRGEARPLSLADTQDLLPDARTALLEYVVTETRTYLFVVTKRADGAPVLDSFTIVVTRKTLGDLAERFRAQLARRDAGFGISARRLYDLLLRPAQRLLSGRDTVIIVPETVLWNLPFQALQSSPTRYAIEDHAFSFAPSLTVLREMGRATPLVGDHALLAVGNPASSLAPLPDAETQARNLSRLYGQARSDVLVGAAATEERVKRTAGQYKVLHLATHSVFDNASPMHSYVVLAQGAKGSADDGLLEAREIMDLDLHANLVVLSACETARGRAGAGEGVIGLTWAFFVAGTPTTVVSQWQVESSSTTALMLAFHRSRLGAPRSGVPAASTAHALRKAALSLMKGGIYRHPFYWAGFVVVGDGR